MGLERRIKRALLSVIAPIVFISLVAYFMWNATQGDRGLQAYAAREQHLAALNVERGKVEQEMHDWERRVSELRAQHLDPDMLDERARAMLNLVDPNDVVVPYGQNKRLFAPP